MREKEVPVLSVTATEGATASPSLINSKNHKRAYKPLSDESVSLTQREARALAQGWDGKNFKSFAAFEKAFASAFVKLRSVLNG